MVFESAGRLGGGRNKISSKIGGPEAGFSKFKILREATGNKARTMDFQQGDVGYVQKTLLHYIENTGDTDLVFLEIFKADRYQDLSFSEWLAHTPPELVVARLHIDKVTLAAIPKKGAVVTPLS